MFEYNESGPLLAQTEQPYAHIESMTKIIGFGFSIRVWRQEKEFKLEYDNQDLVDIAHDMRHSPAQEILKTILAQPRVTAAELTGKLGNGVVVYTEWP